MSFLNSWNGAGSRSQHRSLWNEVLKWHGVLPKVGTSASARSTAQFVVISLGMWGYSKKLLEEWMISCVRYIIRLWIWNFTFEKDLVGKGFSCLDA